MREELSIVDTVVLKQRLDLVNEPELLGFAIELFTDDDSHKALGFVQDFKFKFTTINPDSNSVAYRRLVSPSLSTKLETYCFDLETALLILKILDWHGESARLCYVLKHFRQGSDQLIITPVDYESSSVDDSQQLLEGTIETTSWIGVPKIMNHRELMESRDGVKS